jgi:hypothetical protein
MKIIKSIILSVSLILATSCTLDLQEDPNAVQPSQTVPGLILNSMQRNLAGLFNGASTNGMILSRLQNSGGSTYANVFNPQSFDGTWSTAYSNILQDAKVLTEQADASGLARHAGMARVISAYTLLLLVDSFGDVPYSQAFQGSTNFNPEVDDMASLYDVALGLLDKAIEDLGTPTTTAGGYLAPTAAIPTDLYYYTHVGQTSAGAVNYTNWIRAANSLKLKAYLNLRLTNAAAATAGINAVITHPVGLITTSAQNFIFRYGVSTADPDARHPRFVGSYPAGGGAYMSNWLMWHMFWGYGAQQNGAQGDPRMRFYFYRQTNTNSTNPNDIRCVTGTVPAHYPQSTGTAIIDNNIAGRPPLGLTVSNDPASGAWNRTFCYPSDRGYWGRDHVNNEGIPPDNLLRTTWGVYPAGGRFDANVNAGVNANLGMKGAGFQPLMMRSYVDFMLAEAALYLGVVPPGANNTATLRFAAGITNSMDDARAWAVNGTFGGPAGASAGEATLINTYYPQATFDSDRNNYVTSALAAFNAQASNDGKMNYVAREYWIALFGNGVEAWNLYRRTGMPTGMQPALNPSPGAFPRSYYYPANFATLNSTIEQKSDLAGRVFWDTNSSNLDF